MKVQNIPQRHLRDPGSGCRRCLKAAERTRELGSIEDPAQNALLVLGVVDRCAPGKLISLNMARPGNDTSSRCLLVVRPSKTWILFFVK